MVVITVNMPNEFVKEMEKYVGPDNYYVSNSEFYRVSITNFLVQELNRSALKFGQKTPKTYSITDERVLHYILRVMTPIHDPVENEVKRGVMKLFFLGVTRTCDIQDQYRRLSVSTIKEYYAEYIEFIDFFRSNDINQVLKDGKTDVMKIAQKST